jgi:membrane fusion protein (multidrug efflux system)
MRLVLFAPLAAGALLAASACSDAAKSAAPAQRPPVAVETAAVAAGDVVRTLDVVGTLAPKAQAEIKPDYSGTVAEVLVTEWVPVRRGQVLARLDSREEEANLLQAKARAAQAEREYERALKLKEAGLMTAQGLEDAQTQRDAAAAVLAYARTRVDKTVIRSPMEGVVAYRGVSAGDFVQNMGSDSVMFRIVDNRQLDLTVAVPSSRICEVKVGQPIAFTTEAAPGRAFEGHVAFINPAAEEASRTVQVRAVVPNPGGELKAGLFVKGVIQSGTRAGVPLLPREALLAWDMRAGTAEVFAVEDGQARRRSIKTGALQGGMVEVAEGLKPGDAVVTRGGFNLQDGDRVTTGRASDRAKE